MVLSILKGIWSEGLDVTSTAHRRIMMDRAGVEWHELETNITTNNNNNDNSHDIIYKDDDTITMMTDKNAADLNGLGLWGVPSFACGDGFSVWGQDRLWALKQHIYNSNNKNNKT